MILGICSIQRDRAPWIEEWVLFHYLLGVRKFFIFLHSCSDNSADVIGRLKNKFDITCFIVDNSIPRPQLSCYQFILDNYSNEVDWLAFIDGDEFLHGVRHNDIRDVLENKIYNNVSAVAVYWACFGSSGHIVEPPGLITLNYRFRPSLNHRQNQHIKSIIKCHNNAVSVLSNSHLFQTVNGTYDELMRPINSGFTEFVPSHETLKINHYPFQSWSFFKNWKQYSGAADGNPNLIRPDSLFHELDEEAILDEDMNRFIPSIESMICR